MEPVLEHARAILRLINAKCPHIGWRMQNLYSNGKGTNIQQISFFTPANDSVIGKVAFHPENGQVLNMHYKGFRGHSPRFILDLLFDILNLERRSLLGA